MKMVPLGELITPARTLRAGEQPYPLLSMTMHHGLMDQSARFKKRVASNDTSSYKVIRRGQLVVGFPIDEGVLDFQTLHDQAIVSPAYEVWDVDTTRVTPSHLRRFLKSPIALSFYQAKLQGSTARRRSLPRADFLDLPVPLPSMDEQRRIAAILDQADALRAKRREQLALLDALPQAIFHDMFGHAEHRHHPLKELATTSSGSTPNRKDCRYYEGGYIPWVKSGELHQRAVTITEETVTEAALRETPIRIIQPGAVLVAMYGATAGAVSHLTIRATTNQAVCAIECGPRLHPDYLATHLRTITQTLLSKRSGGAQPNLSQAILRNLLIPLPDIDEQQRFSAALRELAPRQHAAQIALSELDALFASLQTRAFRGEL